MTYGVHMPTRHKTTVYLDSEDYTRLERLSREQGRSIAALIREAVGEFGRQQSGRALHRSLGAGKSGRVDLSERDEKLLTGFGEDAPSR